MYAYKADISNYFNSIDVDRFLPELQQAISDDPELFAFLSVQLSEPRVLEKGKELIEQKGIMAGTPLSAFYANLYLRDLDGNLLLPGSRMPVILTISFSFLPRKKQCNCMRRVCALFSRREGLC